MKNLFIILVIGLLLSGAVGTAAAQDDMAAGEVEDSESGSDFFVLGVALVIIALGCTLLGWIQDNTTREGLIYTYHPPLFDQKVTHRHVLRKDEKTGAVDIFQEGNDFRW